MDRWSILAGVTFLCVLAGSYIVFSRPDELGRQGDKTPEAELGVEDFETEEVAEDVAPASDEEAPAAVSAEQGPRTARREPPRRAGSDTGGAVETVETIEDDSGETFDPPVTIEDDDEQGTEVTPPPNRGG